MKIEFDPAKREWTLRERGLDLAASGRIFDGFRLTHEDEREDYGEARFVTWASSTAKQWFVCGRSAAKLAAS